MPDDLMKGLKETYGKFDNNINSFYYTLISFSGGAVIATISFIKPDNFPTFYKYSAFLHYGWIGFTITMICAFLRIFGSIYFDKRLNADSILKTSVPVGTPPEEHQKIQKRFFKNLGLHGKFVTVITLLIPVFFIISVILTTIFAILITQR